MPDPCIGGRFDPAFAGLREAFAANFAEEQEVGAAVCVAARDRTLVDLWGGWQDAGRTRAWERETLVNVYSVGKGVVAALALALAERGRLDLDARVPDLWPGFEAHGKGALRVRDLLAHRAGLPAVRETLACDAWAHWDCVTGALAAQLPWWTPGKDHGYHVNTWGYLVGELVRRATGRGFGAALRDWVTGPTAADFHVGLPAREHARCARVVAPAAGGLAPGRLASAFPSSGDASHDEMVRKTYFNPPGLSGTGVVNTAAWRRAEVPSTNGHGTARGVARIYAALLDGRLAGPGLVAEAARVHSDGSDRVLGRPSRFGLGFQLAMPERPIGPSPRAFGHFGYGGSLGFADPDAGIAFAYLMNRPGERWQTARVQRLVDALYASLR